ncbi:hypothetical protein U1Q18_051081, partial [Sarracenia purpurea var. burkii]
LFTTRTRFTPVFPSDGAGAGASAAMLRRTAYSTRSLLRRQMTNNYGAAAALNASPSQNLFARK